MKVLSYWRERYKYFWLVQDPADAWLRVEKWDNFNRAWVFDEYAGPIASELEMETVR